jgi:prophage regulatory protein
MQKRLVEYDGLRARGIPQGPVQLWRLWKAGKFPRPVKVGSRNAWVESEIDVWIAERIAARDTAGLAGAPNRNAPKSGRLDSGFCHDPSQAPTHFSLHTDTCAPIL